MHLHSLGGGHFYYCSSRFVNTELEAKAIAGLDINISAARFGRLVDFVSTFQQTKLSEDSVKSRGRHHSGEWLLCQTYPGRSQNVVRT